MKRDAHSVSSYATTAIRKLRVMMLRGRIVVLFLLVVLIAVVFSGTSLSRKTFTVSAKVSGQDKSEPSLTTDRENYSPGDAITFTGRNWKAGEAVSVVVSEDTGGEKVTLET